MAHLLWEKDMLTPNLKLRLAVNLSCELGQWWNFEFEVNINISLSDGDKKNGLDVGQVQGDPNGRGKDYVDTKFKVPSQAWVAGQPYS